MSDKLSSNNAVQYLNTKKKCRHFLKKLGITILLKAMILMRKMATVWVKCLGNQGSGKINVMSWQKPAFYNMTETMVREPSFWVKHEPLPTLFRVYGHTEVQTNEHEILFGGHWPDCGEKSICLFSVPCLPWKLLESHYL